MNEWIFDPGLPSRARSGGSGGLEVFRREIDYLVRETLQNSNDQKLDEVEAVQVRFSLEELTGADLVDFLSALRWEPLRDHIEAVAGMSGYVTFAPRLQSALKALDDTDALRILRIEDTGTHGLAGGEDDHDSNFNLLCRDELISSGQRRQSGGSFGLGKSVLWLFSGLSTVLFGSTIRDDTESGITPRFFGRTLLPWHEADGRPWHGSGWLGLPDNDGQRAVSVLGPAAGEAAEAVRLGRNPAGTGTSILLVGFNEPMQETQRKVPEICTDIVASAARWFWPAIEERRLEVLVEGRINNQEEFSQHVHRTAEVTHFALAENEPTTPSELLSDPGDVVERELEIEVPAQRMVPGMIEDPRPAVTGSVRLRVRLAETGETDHANTVALQRGTGMVVDYHEPFRRAAGDSPFHAVLLAGTKLGDSQSDQAVEEFLRASEPPAHDDWMRGTERLKAIYGGGGAVLTQLKEAIANTLRELTREETGESTEGPDALQRLFPLPGAGPAPTKVLPYRLSDAEASLEGAIWSFRGRFERRERKSDKWRFRVALLLDQESAGSHARAQKAMIADLSVDAGEVHGPRPDGSFDVSVPKKTDEVTFHGKTEQVAGLPAGGLRRVRVSLDVRSVRGDKQ